MTPCPILPTNTLTLQPYNPTPDPYPPPKTTPYPLAHVVLFTVTDTVMVMVMVTVMVIVMVTVASVAVIIGGREGWMGTGYCSPIFYPP